ncbi:uncharacterized protein si:dkey-121a11.3 isoform X1 [Platichthys flesus]|uniref:uncharacterized protein si:dkey-121a11.3 isoform X1 n=1 Tax=Platichthys flesus TaxID=8260 RepID=UPI002DB589A9|nr:uncharacterized protein si:dkey-121a11.3 isoform X1 [Platichthys flesus]XP_062251686.1 uncharacterized protein si:dkey-121a11.3 isoform X1 [Platichthys flesus]XP_062251687.1 uncharacterized protein si:dkey-121a11.3 isoform X1 [Platichthys flesus]
MKRRCVPLRGDHNLLTPDTHALSGVRNCPVIRVRLEGVASHSGHQSDLSSSQSAVGSTRRRPASSTRRLRFEDETETEAESRYQERQQQRRWAGQQGTGVLVSRLNLNLYVSGQAGPPVPVDRGRSLSRPHVNLRTEPIRETYIGPVTPQNKSLCRGGGAERVTNIQMRSRTNEGTPTTDLPINPYAPDQLTTPAFTCPSPSSPLLVISVMTSQSVGLNGSEEEQDLNHDQDTQGRPEGLEPNKELQSVAEPRDQSPCVEVEEGGGIRRMKNSSSSSSSGTSTEATAERSAPPIQESSRNGRVNQPIRTKLYTSLPEQFSSREEPSRLSLRRLLSSARLGRTRTSSLDRHSIRARPSALDPAPSSLLSLGSPFFQLRKVLSVQSVVSEQKKRDGDYRPAADT